MYKVGDYIIIECKPLEEMYVAIKITDNDYVCVKKIEGGNVSNCTDLTLYINNHNEDEYKFITKINVDLNRIISNFIKKSPEVFL